MINHWAFEIGLATDKNLFYIKKVEERECKIASMISQGADTVLCFGIERCIKICTKIVQKCKNLQYYQN